jgi:hypothetical protein
MLAVLGAVAAPAGAKPQTLHLRFQRIAKGVDGHCGNAVVTSGAYMLVSLGPPGSQACASRFLLIDDRTGKHTVLRPGGYTYVLAFGAPWILFARDLNFELYNLATRKWRPLGCNGRCQPDATVGYVLGTRWLEFIVEGQQSCGDGVHFECGPDTYAYYNLHTHEVRHGSPQTSKRIVDLDSPTLVRRLCAPLRVPEDGSLTLEGRVGIATGARGSYLERCGSRARMPLDTRSPGSPDGGLIESSQAVLRPLLGSTGAWSGKIDGVWLSSRRRFSATVPVRLNPNVALIALDATHLYLVDGRARLWAATL